MSDRQHSHDRVPASSAQVAFVLAMLAALAFALPAAAIAAGPPTTFVPDAAADRDQFGAAVDLTGDMLAVGAHATDLGRDDAGAWTLQERLAHAATSAYDEFGIAVAAHGSVAAVGTPSDIPAGMTEDTITGTVTMFRKIR